MGGRDWNQKLLDDLTENKSQVTVDCGDTLVRGIYQGLVRKPNGWYILIACREGGKTVKRFVQVDEIQKILRPRRKAN